MLIRVNTTPFSKRLERAKNDAGLYKLRKGMARVALERKYGKNDAKDAHGTRFTYANEMADRHNEKTLSAWASGKATGVSVGAGAARRTPWPWEEKGA